jgi:5-methylthioadenosine/S-adenosylhomocysteine deaminase
MATLGGARALGWEGDIGSLEAGKRADVIAVDLRRPGLGPVHDFSLIGNLVHAGSGADVRFAMVDGRVLLQDGAVTFADEDALVRRAQRCAERVLARLPYRLRPRWPFIADPEGPR